MLVSEDTPLKSPDDDSNQEPVDHLIKQAKEIIQKDKDA